MKRTLSDVAAACGGVLQGADGSFGGVSIDTRTIQAGDLFVALQGPHFDGHDFVAAAFGKGAAGALVQQAAGAGAQVVVADTLQALQRLSTAWRSQFAIPVLGVAGSNGKTTVKEMTASILGQTGSCLATRGNLNNHIGVPLTLLRLEAGHRSAVIEMGANRAGDVAELVGIARPGIGLIVNAGAEHLEGFGDLDGVARAEGEMVATLAADGIAVINADDAYANLWRGMAGVRRVVSFGLAAEAEVRATGLSQFIADGEFNLGFTLHLNAGGQQTSAPVTLKLAGRHNVTNALAAAAAAHAAGASLEAIVAGLSAMRAVAGRLQLKRAHSGAWLIDDTYNANPSSLQAALDVLGGLTGEKWLVLGGMGELGAAAPEAHADAGRRARAQGVTRLFATGPLTELAVQTFGAGAQGFATVEALIEHLKAAAPAQGTVLIKGSRFNRLERVVNALTGT